jgi:hypothetical protein
MWAGVFTRAKSREVATLRPFHNMNPPEQDLALLFVFLFPGAGLIGSADTRKLSVEFA